MALRSCYECNKEISTKAIMCPQCGAPQNPVSDLIDKAIDKAKEGGGFLQNAFKKVKNHLESEREQKEVVQLTGAGHSDSSYPVLLPKWYKLREGLKSQI